MNLQNLNLIELNAQEVQEVEGGSFWEDLGYAAGYVAGTFVKAARNITRIAPADGGNATWADK